MDLSVNKPHVQSTQHVTQAQDAPEDLSVKKTTSDSGEDAGRRPSVSPAASRAASGRCAVSVPSLRDPTASLANHVTASLPSLAEHMTVSVSSLADHMATSMPSLLDNMAVASLADHMAVSMPSLADHLTLSVLDPTARMVADLDQYLRSLAELRSSSLADQTLRSLAHQKAKTLAGQCKRTAELKAAALVVPKRSALVVPKPRSRAAPAPRVKSEQSPGGAARAGGAGQTTSGAGLADQGLDLRKKGDHRQPPSRPLVGTGAQPHANTAQLRDGKTHKQQHLLGDRGKSHVLKTKGSVLADLGDLSKKHAAKVKSQEAKDKDSVLKNRSGLKDDSGHQDGPDNVTIRPQHSVNNVLYESRSMLHDIRTMLQLSGLPLHNGTAADAAVMAKTKEEAGSTKRKRKQDRPQKRVKLSTTCPPPPDQLSTSCPPTPDQLSTSSSPTPDQLAASCPPPVQTDLRFLPSAELLKQVTEAAQNGELSKGLDVYFSHAAAQPLDLQQGISDTAAHPQDLQQGLPNSGTEDGHSISAVARHLAHTDKGTAEGVELRTAEDRDTGTAEDQNTWTTIRMDTDEDVGTAVDTDTLTAADTDSGTAVNRAAEMNGDSASPASSPESGSPGKFSPSKSRASRMSVSLHNREQRKALRLYGKEYTTPSGKTYPQRQVRPKDCSKCRYNCSSSVSPSQRQAIFDHFWSLDSYVKRLYYYCQSIKEKPAKTMKHTRECCREYTFLVGGDRVRVCKGFYLATLDVSDKAVRIAMEKRKRGKGMWDKRGAHPPHNKTRPEDKDRVRCHIERVLIQEIYAKTGSNSNTTPGQDLNITNMHRDYAKECAQESREPVSEDVYRKTFNTEYNLASVQV